MALGKTKPICLAGRFACPCRAGIPRSLKEVVRARRAAALCAEATCGETPYGVTTNVQNKPNLQMGRTEIKSWCRKRLCGTIRRVEVRKTNPICGPERSTKFEVSGVKPARGKRRALWLQTSHFKLSRKRLTASLQTCKTNPICLGPAVLRRQTYAGRPAPSLVPKSHPLVGPRSRCLHSPISHLLVERTRALEPAS
jgi:hypothetical protein